MQGHAEADSRHRLDQHRRTLDDNPPVAADAVIAQFPRRQVAERDIAPIDARHQIVAFDEGLKPLDQFLWRPLGREAALGHAEHDPQHRIDPMAELALIFLELGDAGDVGKGDEHAVQCPVGGAIRQDAHQVMRLAIAPHDPPLAAFAVGKNGLDFVAQIEVGEFADDVGQRPAAVEIDQVEDRFDRGGEAADHQLFVEKHQADFGALE